MYYIIAFLCVVMVLYCVVTFAPMFSADEKKRCLDGYNYSRQSILTPAEERFYRILLGCLPSGVLVWCKLGLWAIVKNEQKEGRGKIAQKHLDFVIVKANDLSVIAVIELDDKSHETESARKRDNEKDGILSDAGIPIIRIKVQKEYNREEITKKIQELA